MIRLNNILNEVIQEGGAGGHMAHPFDFVNWIVVVQSHLILKE